MVVPLQIRFPLCISDDTNLQIIIIWGEAMYVVAKISCVTKTLLLKQLP